MGTVIHLRIPRRHGLTMERASRVLDALRVRFDSRNEELVLPEKPGDAAQVRKADDE